MVCECLEHFISRIWFAASGDSYVVKVKKMEGPSWAASYMAKYFTKDFYFQADRIALGFSRAWSRSRNWPGDKLQLLQTIKGGWHHVEFHVRVAEEWIERINALAGDLLERTGTDLAKELALRTEKRVTISQMSRAKELLGL